MSYKGAHAVLGRLRQSPLIGVVASVMFVAMMLELLITSGGRGRILELLRWVKIQGLGAPLLFILIMAAAVVLVLPGLPLTAGAGFVFGLVTGFIYVVLGTTLGAVISFVIARYLFDGRARRFILSRARLRAIGEEMTPHGWKIVLLTRPIPFFPSKLVNYFFGLTPIEVGRNAWSPSDRLSLRSGGRRWKDLLIYVHGAKVNFYNANAFAAQLDHFMGRDMTSLAFSWPTRQNIMAYGTGGDVRRAYRSAPALSALLEALARGFRCAQNSHCLLERGGTGGHRGA